MKILKVNQKNFKKIIDLAVAAFKAGAVLIGPSDTVYGIYCNALDHQAVRKLFRIKKRPAGKPVSIFVNDLKTAKKFSHISPAAERFLKLAWPGPLTAVLKPKTNLLSGLCQKKSTIGIRVPKSKLLLQLIKKLGQPLAESSANISGRPALTKIKEVIRQFENKKIKPEVILDAGNLKPSLASTVVDFTKRLPTVLREGPLTVKIDKKEPKTLK